MLYLDDPVSGARAEYVLSTSSWKDYVMAPGGIAAIVPTDSALLRFVQRDNLGSTEALTDSTGTRVEQDSYGPWGLRRNVDGTDEQYGG